MIVDHNDYGSGTQTLVRVTVQRRDRGQGGRGRFESVIKGMWKRLRERVTMAKEGPREKKGMTVAEEGEEKDMMMMAKKVRGAEGEGDGREGMADDEGGRGEGRGIGGRQRGL